MRTIYNFSLKNFEMQKVKMSLRAVGKNKVF